MICAAAHDLQAVLALWVAFAPNGGRMGKSDGLKKNYRINKPLFTISTAESGAENRRNLFSKTIDGEE